MLLLLAAVFLMEVAAAVAVALGVPLRVCVTGAEIFFITSTEDLPLFVVLVLIAAVLLFL